MQDDSEDYLVDEPFSAYLLPGETERCLIEHSFQCWKILLESFTSEDTQETDLTAAEELVRGLTFDRYEEGIYCKILTKIKEENFEKGINRITARYQIPADIRDSLLDVMDGEVNQDVIREFKFNKGSSGSVLYGRLVSIKREDSTIDLAYAIFSLGFELSPKKIEERRRKKFFGLITYGAYTVVRFEERNLSVKEKEQILDFYRTKALKGFKKEYPSLADEARSEL